MRCVLWASGLILVMSLALGQAPAPAGGEIDVALDEALLQKYQVPTDGKGLLEYVQKRTFALPDPKVIAELVKQLGDEDYQVREQAYLKLLQFGPGATEMLKQASTSDDIETKKRAVDLLKHIESEADPVIQTAIFRLIALRKPQGAPEVVLAYLPFVADDEVAEEICATLAKVGIQDGKGDPALVKALTDQLSIKRRAAGLALARGKADKNLPELQKLLADADLAVRLDVGLAMVTSLREKQAIPAIIELLDALPVDQLWEAENVLLKLAAGKGPSERLAPNRVARDKVKKAWQQWWDTNKNAIDFTRLDTKVKDEGQFIAIHQTNAPNPGGGFGTLPRKIVGKDKQNKDLFQFIIHNTTPVDVLVLGNGKLALIEETAKRVTLRDMEGRIQKEFYFTNGPIGGQLLPNGNILVVFRFELIEISQEGKRIFQFSPPGGDIYRACKLRDNVIAFVSGNGKLNYLDTDSKAEVKSFHVGAMVSYHGGLDALPNGNVLVPLQNQNQVLEYNIAGKVVKRFPVSAPASACYLPNGNVLVGSQLTKTVQEVNRQGKTYWNQNCDGSVYQVHYR